MRRNRGPRVLWALLVVLAAAGLFACYWRQSLGAIATSDGASFALQAWDMLHGNVLLHGWHLADVSFYTTELPQYMLIESLSGLGPWVVHIATAMTYTLLVLLAGAVARGDARGAEGLTRALVAAGIIVAPQLTQTTTLLGPPDHTGSAVPVLLTWLIIDAGRRTPRTWRQWIAAIAVCLILAVGFAADTLVLVTGIAPVIAACAGQLVRDRAKPRWYELTLAAAAAAAAGLGWAIGRLVSQAGGYTRVPVDTHLISVRQLGHAVRVAGQNLLDLFGADVFRARPGIEYAAAVVHLTGVLLVACAFLLAVRHVAGSDLLVAGLAWGIAFNLAAYMLTGHGQGIANVREIAAVMPLGAALAGRVLASPIRKLRLVPVLSVVAAAYLLSLGYAAAQPPTPAPDQALARWLAAHQLRDGLGGYWQANIVTLDSGGRIKVSCAWGGNGSYVPCGWETQDADYDPQRYRPTFYVLSDGGQGAEKSLKYAFGPAPRVYHVAGYTVMVWDANLLRRLG